MVLISESSGRQRVSLKLQLWSTTRVCFIAAYVSVYFKKTKREYFASLVHVSDHVYFVHPSTDISADISTDCRPMYRSTYRSSIGRYVGRHIGRQSVDMSTEMCRSTYRPMYIGRVMVDISTDYRQISRSI